MDLVGDLLKQVGTGDNLAALSTAVGGDSAGVQSALGLALPMLMGSMANTAARPGGADMLTSMMGQLGGESPAGDMAAYLSTPAAATGGGDIVSRLLGSQMGAIQNAIAQKTGLPPAVIGSVLAIVTPMMLRAVSQAFTGKKMDQAGLTSLLGDQAEMAMKSSPDAAALAGQFLDVQQESTGILGSIKKILGM
ncbi:MAG: DUF937 domain-containing protein [Methanospirillum sp.]|nr:DUF937 domain-containing protein [Methanospirillum sp.]